MEYPYITISLTSKTLTFVISKKEQQRFPIAIGKPDTPTPKGTWQIQNKKILSDTEVFGSHWLGLSLPGYGIHGTNRPELIGKAVSGGCIRMLNQDIQSLFQQTHIGTLVIIAE